ncbi:hypothetical protein [Anaerococcus sp. Marseille-P3915]|uniref:hypothetical protein n=1 Tax=Anaerococcus sp. Marseille-P3915 TaxID=2057799 RepID=UPI000D0BE05F|nr:hypothetical protein [Anaerococcus sp. Marseille-P3915]
MSKTLGPIHYMMYEKIKFQDKITDYLMDGHIQDIKPDPVSTKPLEEILDQENIHGYLQEKIDIVETRLAKAIKLTKDPDEKLYKLGQECGKDKDFSSFEQVFKALNTYLLDGMPCDQGLAAMVDGESLYLITNNNLHSKYDEEIDLEKSKEATCEGGHGHDHHESFEIQEGNLDLKEEQSTYHTHRLAFLKGYFSDSPYKVSLVNGINYKISPR